MIIITHKFKNDLSPVLKLLNTIVWANLFKWQSKILPGNEFFIIISKKVYIRLYYWIL